MALSAYLTLTGETQGTLKGSVTQKGREGTIEVIACSHRIVSPRDAASGHITGAVAHQPLTIVKNVDASTPLLYTAMVSNENLPKWELRFFAPSASGVEVNHYTINLTNASIAEIHMEMLNNRYPDNMRHAERETISFCYEKIGWTWMLTKIAAEDDWGSVRA